MSKIIPSPARPVLLWVIGCFVLICDLHSSHVEVSLTNSALVPCLLSLTHFCKVDTVTPSAGAVQIPKDSKAQSLNRIHLYAPVQTPCAPLLIIPHPPLINACLLQQVKPFQFEEGRNYVKEKCNYSGLQPASFRLKDKDSRKPVEKPQLIREDIAQMLDLQIFKISTLPQMFLLEK